MNADKLADALRDIKRDLEMCDWTCERCGKDYGMCETDAYHACVEALAEHDAQPAQAAQWPDALKAIGFNDAAAVIGYLDNIDSEVARITGDEGEDSSLEVLRRMPAQAAQPSADAEDVARAARPLE